MQLAQVKGHATATVRHKSLVGARLLVCELLGASLKPAGDPVLAIDKLGAGCGDMVILTSDGLGLRELLKDETSPARWWTLGIVDEQGLTFHRDAAPSAVAAR
jgi:ethanolamine utilization protein EutN